MVATMTCASCGKSPAWCQCTPQQIFKAEIRGGTTKWRGEVERVITEARVAPTGPPQTLLEYLAFRIPWWPWLVVVIVSILSGAFTAWFTLPLTR